MWGRRAHDNFIAEDVHAHAGERAVVRGELPEDNPHRIDLGAAAVGLRGGHLVGGSRVGWRRVGWWRRRRVGWWRRVVRWRSRQDPQEHIVSRPSTRK